LRRLTDKVLLYFAAAIVVVDVLKLEINDGSRVV